MQSQASDSRLRHVVFHGKRVPARTQAFIAFTPPVVPPASEDPNDAVDLNDPEALFCRWVLQRVGLVPENYRFRPLKRRVPACLRALRVSGVDEALRLVRHDPELLSVAADALVLGVTSLFRDPAVFDELRELMDAPTWGRGPVRAWCVGCSDGAELYSLGMLLAESGALIGSSLLGSDCRSGAIAAARRGWFSSSAVDHVPPELLRRYLVADAGGFRVVPLLSGAIQWRVEDALTLPEVGRWDLILCRNLAIYLAPASARMLWATLSSALRPGGLLVVGKADYPAGPSGLRRISRCIYHRSS